MQSPNVKGNVAELAIAKAAAELALPVYGPLTEHSRYDLVIEIAGRLFRVQCKWARLIREKSVIYVQIGGNRSTPKGYVRSVYARDEVDLIGVYCAELDRCYLVPIEIAEGRYALHLRLEPAKNGQRAGIREAARFELPGAVAQLARASAWHAEGRGFESPQLHSPPRNSEAVVVGANEFRNRFGWYMERAAAGEEFHVERRGRPHVRLTGAAPQLLLDGVPTLKQASRGLFVGRFASEGVAA